MNRRLIGFTAAAVVVGLLVDVIVGYSLPGYPAIIGLAGCIAIIVVSKWLGKVWLQRPPDYYSADGHRETKSDG